MLHRFSELSFNSEILIPESSIQWFAIANIIYTFYSSKLQVKNNTHAAQNAVQKAAAASKL